MCGKMKYRFYSYVYMYENDHYEKNLFKSVNNIPFIFRRNAIVY